MKSIVLRLILFICWSNLEGQFEIKQLFKRTLLPPTPEVDCLISVHSDVLPTAASPVHAAVLRGCAETHQGRLLRNGYGVPCQSVVQSHYNVNTDFIRNLKTG